MRQCEYFQEVSKARMRQIDEIRAAGGQTELEKWKDEDIAYMVQRRPHVTFKVIANCLGKSIASCNTKYRKIQSQGKLDYYMNYKLESIEW